VPASIGISVTAAGLVPGTYQGAVTVTAPNANPSMHTVAVTFNVTQANPPRLGVEPSAISLSFKSGAPAANVPIDVSNLGTGSLVFTAVVSTDSGGAWLTVAPASGTVSATSTVALTGTANPAGLAPGTYTGRVSILSSTTGEKVDIPVSIAI